MAQRGANLFEDERGVSLLHQPAEQRIGVGEEEAVLPSVECADFLVDVGEQTQLVEVSQGQFAGVECPSLFGALFFRLDEQGLQLGRRQGDDFRTSGGCLRRPVVGGVEALLHGAVADVVAPLSVAQLLEVGGDAAALPGKVVGAQSFRFENAEELVGDAVHHVRRLVAQCLEQLAVGGDGLRVRQLGAQSVALLDVGLVEDVQAEAFDFARHVPAFVRGDAFADELQEPSQHGRASVELLDEDIDGVREHLGVVERDVHVGTQFQFPRQVAHHRLEERVDGFHAEAAVVMNQQGEGAPCLVAHLLRGQSQSVADHVQVGIRCRIPDGDAEELSQDAFLHFRGRLVGKGHREDVAVGGGVGYEELDVFHGERERLSRARRSLVDEEFRSVVHHDGRVKVGR